MENYTFVEDSFKLVLSIINGIFLGIGSGLFGYVFIAELIKPDAILDWWTPFTHRVLGLTDYSKQPKKWQLKMDKVLNVCAKCFSGQFAMWLYLTACITYGLSFLGVFTCIAVGILTAKYLDKQK